MLSIRDYLFYLAGIVGGTLVFMMKLGFIGGFMVGIAVVTLTMIVSNGLGLRS